MNLGLRYYKFLNNNHLMDYILIITKYECQTKNFQILQFSWF